MLKFSSSEGVVGGLIVETEAYLGINDSASFAFNGKKSSLDQPLFGPGGTIFIYKTYNSYMLDVVTQASGIPEGIVIRAIEPKFGNELMKKRRGVSGPSVTNGPGKLTAALGIETTVLNGQSYRESTLTLDWPNRLVPKEIISAQRMGNANTPQLRFYVRGNAFVSRSRKVNKT